MKANREIVERLGDFFIQRDDKEALNGEIWTWWSVMDSRCEVRAQECGSYVQALQKLNELSAARNSN